MNRKRGDRGNYGHVWRAPILIGLISAVGLVTALLSDTWGDWLYWMALGAVCTAGAWISVRGFARCPAPD